MTTNSPQDVALDSLQHLSNDIAMLASGDWVPDDDSCEACLDMVEEVRVYVRRTHEILSAARELILDVEQGSCPKAASKQLKELMVNLGVWEDFNPEGE